MPNQDPAAEKTEKAVVKMADYAIGASNIVLATLGLGSCIGIALYDKYAKVAGLVHIMLPENPGGKKNQKYADTGIPFLIDEIKNLGAKKRRLSAKIVGGASMFKSESGKSVMKIGQRNIEAVKQTLKKEKIKIVASDVGKDYGRSMYFYADDGRVEVKSFGRDLIKL